MSYIFSFFLLLVLIPLAVGGASLAVWVPTRSKDILRLREVLDLKPGEHFLEIGFGDGRVLAYIAKEYPEASVHGIEIAVPLYLYAKLRYFFTQSKNLEFTLGNALKIDFSRYQHIYVFGLPDTLARKILPKFQREAPVGAKLYSYTFSFPEECRSNVVSYGTEKEQKIHIYTKK